MTYEHVIYCNIHPRRQTHLRTHGGSEMSLLILRHLSYCLQTWELPIKERNEKLIKVIVGVEFHM